MTDQELNERLAKFAGFGFYISPLSTSVLDLKTVWYYPVSGTNCHHLPDFKNDLNAIFKWLVPEIKGIPVITLDLDPECDGTRAYGCLLQIKDCYDVVVHRYVAWSNEPARALAEAIGQMIDNE